MSCSLMTPGAPTDRCDICGNGPCPASNQTRGQPAWTVERYAQQICNTYSLSSDRELLSALFDFQRAHAFPPETMVLITEEVIEELRTRNGGVYLGGLAR